jgi:putative DNA primase/helicase
MTTTIEQLKVQPRWVLWRLETVHGKQTKVPYQPSGRKAMANNPGTWHTYAECAVLASQFSGVGLVLGDGVWGVDIDGCCDAVTGKFTPESREIVIALDSYGEYSPSGTGCHVLGLGKLPGPGLKKPHPGCKAVEVKAGGYYFTFTGRHLSKTPPRLMDRQDEVLALYERVSHLASQSKTDGLSVAIPVSEEERFRKLMAGDMSDYRDDHSTADFALCILLAKKHGCNAFKIDAEFRESGLYREKWERDDYRENTITRAVTAVAKEAPVIFADPEDEPIEDDGETEFLVESLEGPGNDGWFPKGELSLIGAPSGVGKTSWAMPLLEKIRHAQDVWNHKVSKARDYRVLLHDRSKKAMRRTARALHMSDEAMERVIRLTSEQQKREPAEILQACVDASPGVEVWFIEGLDLWIPDMNKMNVVAPIVDSLQRIATRYNVAVLATVGAPKQKGKDRYYGRDGLFGSAALARKVETVVLMSLHNEEDPNSVRRCWVLPRAGRAEVMYFAWGADGLMLTEKPDDVQDDRSANARMTSAVQAAFKPNEPVVWKPSLGSERTFYRWRKWALEHRLLVQNGGKVYLAATGVRVSIN